MAAYITTSEARAVAIMGVAIGVAAGTLIGFGLAYQRAESKITTACAGQMPAYTAELERSVEFWRTLALRMRTDGVDSLEPIKESP